MGSDGGGDERLDDGGESDERATVFVGRDGTDHFSGAAEGRKTGLGGASTSPATTGGGKFRFSVAFLESCVAKSEACHHSRNLSAKIDVGSNSLSADSNFGITTLAMATGLKMLVLAAALVALLPDPDGGTGAMACAIA